MTTTTARASTLDNNVTVAHSDPTRKGGNAAVSSNKRKAGTQWATSGEESGNENRTTASKKQKTNTNEWVPATESRSMSTTIQKASMVSDDIRTKYSTDDKLCTDKGYWEWLWKHRNWGQ